MSMTAEEFARQLRGGLPAPGRCGAAADFLKGKRPAPPQPEGLTELLEARAIAAALKHKAQQEAKAREAARRKKANAQAKRAAAKGGRFEVAIAKNGKKAKYKDAQLLESCVREDASGAPVWRGVKVLSLRSRNGRVYGRKAVADAIPMYEGCKVYLDHRRPDARGRVERSVVDSFGWLENVRQDRNGDLWADLRYNPDHVHAKALTWYAKNRPSALGISHDAVGRGEALPDGTFRIDQIVTVHSCDLVANPATVSGLYN